MGDGTCFAAEVGVEFLDEVFLFILDAVPIFFGVIGVDGDELFTLEVGDATDLMLDVEIDGDLDRGGGPDQRGEKEEETSNSKHQNLGCKTREAWSMKKSPPLSA